VINLKFKIMANTSETNSGNKSYKKCLSPKEYFLLFGCVLISSIVLIILFLTMVIKIPKEITFDFSRTISVILTMLGVLIAFTAINIYSIFNSQVNDEKNKLKELIEHYQNRITDLEQDEKKIKDKINTFFLDYEKINYRVEVLDIDNSVYNILDNNVSLFGKMDNLEKILQLIENKRKSIKNSNLIDKRRDLLGELIVLKARIDSRIKNENFDKIDNKYFKSAIDRLKVLLNEKESINN